MGDDTMSIMHGYITNAPEPYLRHPLSSERSAQSDLPLQTEFTLMHDPSSQRNSLDEH